MESKRLIVSDDELRERFYHLTSREDIARLLEVDESRLIYHLYIVPLSSRYSTFTIIKRNGKPRAITAPATALKILQQKLNQVLQVVYESKKPAHGFLRERSILTNAQPHIRKRNILNIDLEDFFPSINFGRVRGMFMASPYRLNAEVATLLAQICCYNNQLPQGAPTSPIVSNMICAKLDSELQYLAKKYGCLYTRYADDITFSTYIRHFPPTLASISNSTGRTEIGGELLQVVNNNGFKINTEKSRLQAKNRRQEVTGITVNEKPNVTRRYVRQIRAMLHAWATYGYEKAEKEYLEKYNKKHRHSSKQQPSFKHVVKGKIEFLGMVKGEYDSVYLKLLSKLGKIAPDLVPIFQFRSPVKLYVMTEGKTDAVHLKVAHEKLMSNGLFRNLDIGFMELSGTMGGPKLQKICEERAILPNDTPEIYIFDRDDKTVLPKVTQEGKDYKAWGHNVFSFALPIPSHRDESPDVCIEFYYQDHSLKTKDGNGRRLFLSNEFHPRSGNHKAEPNLHFQGRAEELEHLRIIDDRVFNDRNENVALPKSKFAEYILNRDPGFDNIETSEFTKIFGVIAKIIKENEASTLA